MPILRYSFTLCCQNMKILKINFYDVITWVLYWYKIQKKVFFNKIKISLHVQEHFQRQVHKSTSEFNKINQDQQNLSTSTNGNNVNTTYQRQQTLSTEHDFSFEKTFLELSLQTFFEL